MSWTSAVAIYFIIWWLVLFMVLPFGIKNAAETGEQIGEGNDEGAPVAHGLMWKAGVTTARKRDRRLHPSYRVACSQSVPWKGRYLWVDPTMTYE